MIQKALLAITGGAILSSAVDDDSYVDNVPPVITIAGSKTVTVELGETYTDAGASANDANYGAAFST